MNAFQKSRASLPRWLARCIFLLHPRAWHEAVRLFVTFRIVLYAISFLALALMPLRSGIVEENITAFPDHPFWDGFFRWDSGWYDRIATDGYRVDGRQNTTAFFPLFPYLVRFGGHLFGDRFVFGLILSNVCALLGLWCVYRISQALDPESRQSIAARAVMLMLVFPSSFFLSAYYTEGLYLALTAACLYAYQRRRMLFAGATGFLAVLTRPTGMTLLLALVTAELWAFIRSKKLPSGKVAWLGLMPMGIVVFMLHLQVETGDMWAFTEAQAGWGRSTTFPLLTLWREVTSIDWSFPTSLAYGVDTMKLFDITCVLAMLVAGIQLLRSLESKELGAYLIFNCLVILVSGRVLSAMRFSIVLFPLFFWLSRWLQGKPKAELMVVSASSMLLLFFNLRFMRWYWAG